MIASFPSFPELMARLLANTATCAQPGYFSSIKHVQKQEKKKNDDENNKLKSCIAF